MKQTKQEVPNNDAGKLWIKIKELKINLFGLPDQLIEKYFEPIFVDEKSLHLKYSVPAAIPALETVLGSQYKVEQAQMAGMQLLVISPDPAVAVTSNAHVMVQSK